MFPPNAAVLKWKCHMRESWPAPEAVLPPLFRGLNRLMFRLLAGSRKLQRAALRVEVSGDIGP
jgi:hypothetical protein